MGVTHQIAEEKLLANVYLIFYLKKNNELN